MEKFAFDFLTSVLKKIQTDLAQLTLEGNEQCTVYLAEQENIKKYPCIVLKLEALKPQSSALPWYEFSFSINLISQSQILAKALPSKIACVVTLDSFDAIKGKGPDAGGYQYEYRVTFLEHIGTFWNTTEDRFSVRTQMQYKGSITLDRVRKTNRTKTSTISEHK